MKSLIRQYPQQKLQGEIEWSALLKPLLGAAQPAVVDLQRRSPAVQRSLGLARAKELVRVGLDAEDTLELLWREGPRLGRRHVVHDGLRSSRRVLWEQTTGRYCLGPAKG